MASEVYSRSMKELYNDSMFFKLVIWLLPTSGILGLISPYIGGPQFELNDFIPHILFFILLIDYILITKYEIPNTHPKLARLIDRSTQLLVVGIGLLWFYKLSTSN